MIQQQIRDRLGYLSGSYAVFYKDLSTGFTCFEGNQDKFVAAGVAKLMVLVELFRQFDQGLLQPSQTYELKEVDKAPSIGAISSLHNGIVLTLEDLYKLMISVSDNSAFNILVSMVGLEAINNTFVQLGFKTCQVNRLFFDDLAVSQGIENYFAASEIAGLFDRLYHGQIISREASEALLNTLSLQQRDYVMKYHFEEETKIAHQVGEDTGILHDVGIVMTEKPFILCLCSNEVDTRKTQVVFRDITLMVHQHSKSL